MTEKETGPARIIEMSTKRPFVNDIEVAGQIWKGDNYDWCNRINKALAPLVRKAQAADEMAKVLDEVQYCLKNIWALDRKKFEERVLPQISDVLKVYASANGGE